MNMKLLRSFELVMLRVTNMKSLRDFKNSDILTILLQGSRIFVTLEQKTPSGVSSHLPTSGV